ncbi:MAG: nucleotide pyrophosphohydrolase [Christensenellales bacterium]|jgi:NTP pyrophosphatase (non-canonical NTP hydrolase)
MLHEKGRRRMDLTISEILLCQQTLQEKYIAQWGDLSPEKGRSSLLWAYGELAEAADIIKKEGDDAIMEDPATRARFIEEIADTVMYLGDVLLCYGIDADAFTKVYREKCERNLSRWTP